MRKQMFGFVATLMLGANVLTPVFAQAESLNELDKKESAIAKQSDKISGELQIALNDVNEKYQEVNDIRTKISDNEATLEKTKTEITETEQKIEQRKEAIAERMKAAQVGGMTDRSINALLESKDLGEFLNRAFAMSVIQNAEKTKVASLGEAKEKLTELKATQEKTQAQLKKDSQSLETETTKLDDKMANLKQELADNKTSLEKISQDKEVEKARQAAEKAQKAQAEKEAKEAAKAAEAEKASQAAAAQAAEKAKAEAASQESSQASAQASKPAPSASSSQQQSTTQTSEQPKQEPAKPAEPSTPTTSGRTIQMESTGYSCAESVNTYFTAMGIDLRQNPQVVAVDPSVIPLGSMVEVSGYGIAIAGDTGGAIKGNIIDCHFPTVEQCIQWGRRSVTVTVIS
ncbi:3D domain-containing protein [Enterococcus hulanensis]|uniref:3D domain-containing protein n=1 Tax=Enterococcus hulanensis TaxID=2559929 RepID=A0ABU3F599_9ENTE|nr:3D domain-containing protein [Enterococcus hulanensis]MDT2602315.1 3D domain-containing protein [Enterococcus hulanensis]MDT2611710.1 3D domain-containing protein [Enterococcus hulanensis]MDT2618892.1 3D domain-containing protein [Enterococcus hulanensis]MDT2630387.1 3D domain-containing protein [Enterococcus hulanensis]MDT2657873.1 3D domain-containing protein [Enterococcus hulanensis]